MRTLKNTEHFDEQVVTCTWTGGAQIDQMEDLERLIVETRNSTYELTILCGQRGDLLLRGGRFRDWTAVQLSGACLAGSLLKLRGIYAGLNMEFEHDGRYIVTSPVRRVGIQG